MMWLRRRTAYTLESALRTLWIGWDAKEDMTRLLVSLKRAEVVERDLQRLAFERLLDFFMA